MARQRSLLVNIERMRREMDELLGESWAPSRVVPRRQPGFTPRVDVYICDSDGPKAIVKADLAGIDPDAVSLEISGRELVISGERPVRELEGRVYQRVEIPTGGFRRTIELGVDVEAERARASFEDGMLRVELPLRVAESPAHRVPIERREG
jgi:HSP20 family protein